jgi:hypothetical protein
MDLTFQIVCSVSGIFYLPRAPFRPPHHSRASTPEVDLDDLWLLGQLGRVHGIWRDKGLCPGYACLLVHVDTTDSSDDSLSDTVDGDMRRRRRLPWSASLLQLLQVCSATPVHLYSYRYRVIYNESSMDSILRFSLPFCTYVFCLRK